MPPYHPEQPNPEQPGASKRQIQLELDELVSVVTRLKQHSLDASDQLVSLRDDQSKIKALLNAMEDEIWFCDTDGDLIYTNANAKKWVSEQQTSVIDWLQSTPIYTVDGDSCDMENAPLLRALNGEQVMGEMQMLIHPQTNNRIYQEINAIPVSNAANEIIGAVASVRDVTERYKAELERQVLHNLSRELAQVSALHEMGSTILEQSLAIFTGQAGFVLLINQPDDILVLAHSGLPDSLFDGMHYLGAITTFPGARVAMGGQPFWIETGEAYASEFPRFYQEIASKMGAEAMLGLPLEIGDRVLGSIGVTFHQPTYFSESDRIFYQIVANYCAQALDRSMLYEQAQKNAANQMRQRFARDLHDSATQSLYSAQLLIETLLAQKQNVTADMLWSRLDHLHNLIRGAHAQMRNLLLESRSEYLLQAPLSETLTGLASATMGNSPIQIQVKVDSEITDLPPAAQIAFYYIAREALHNITKHAAASEAIIELQKAARQLIMTIQDNGNGFDPESVTRQIGLDNMADRAAEVGAVFQLSSTPGSGTSIRVELTLA